MDSIPTCPDGDHEPSPDPAADSHEDVERQQHDSGDHNNNNNNPQPQIFFTQELSAFARKLGEEQTRAQLLPCLLTQCQTKDDEIKASFAEEMGNFGVLVGGLEHVHSLFPILEALTNDENVLVREKAVTSLLRLVKDFADEDVQARVFPVVERLCSSVTPPSRAAACPLIAFVYPRVGNDVTRDKLRKLYKKATWDAPIVREQAADVLEHLAKTIEEPHVKSFLVIFKRFAFDSSARVRAKVVKAGISLGSRLPAAQIQANILPSVKIFAKDTSACVRLEVAKITLKLQEAVGKSATVVHLVAMYRALLGDPATTVREISARHIGKFCRKLEKRFQKEIVLQTILPAVLRLVDDSSVKVRTELAAVVMELCPMFSKRDVSKFLWQIFLLLISDNSDEVRVSVISNLGGLKRFLTVNQFDTHVVPFIKFLSTHRTWRSRVRTIRCVSRLATRLGKKFFNATLVDICVGLLVDPVHAIRDEIGVALGKIVSIFGPEWAKDKLLKKVVGIANRERYLYRLSCLSCLRNLARPCGVDLATSTILPAVLALSTDPVPNVRFNVAKTLHKMAPVLAEASLEKQVLPVLKTLGNDADIDVVFFADEAFYVISEMCKAPGIQEESNTT